MVLSNQPIEQVYMVPENKQQAALEDHFHKAYKVFTDCKFIPNAGYKEQNGTQRFLTGIPFPFLNTVSGYPQNPHDWDKIIDQQLKFFSDNKMPFAWFVNENEGEEFKTKLKQRGFIDTGVFQGVIGELNTIPEPNVPKGYTINLVKSEDDFNQFCNLVCDTFQMSDECRPLYKLSLASASKGNSPVMYNWVAKKDGKVVAGVSTFIDKNMVSFWNGATLPNLRKNGLSTAIRQLALRDAISKGCKVGASYLMAEGLALGICKKFGYKTEWRFNTFVAPQGK